MKPKTKQKEAVTLLSSDYGGLLREIKIRIRRAQVRVTQDVNRQLIQLYWDIGRRLEERQAREGWGKAVIPRLARDLHNEFPDEKGFSERNLNRMVSFFREYRQIGSILPQPVAKLAPERPSPVLEELVSHIPWGKIWS